MKRLHPGDVGQFHQVQDPDRHHDEAGLDLVAPVGSDYPQRLLIVPLGRLHGRVEHGIVDQPVLVGNPFEVLADLVPKGVPASGDVGALLEQWHVDVGLHVAHHPGVAVPVPGAADPTGFVDQADPLDPELP